MIYRIRLTNFEGPLDLLLYFIKRDKLNIYDIPIARITHEFLEYVRLMKMLNLEVVGDFLVTASMLLQIKARMLLPKPESEETEEEDPRTELVHRLLEYKRYKEAAEALAERHQQYRYYLYRAIPDPTPAQMVEPVYKNASLLDLLTALKHVLEKAENAASESHVHTVELPPVSVEAQAEFLLNEVKRHGEITFQQLVEGMERLVIIATFLALLELIKHQMVGVRQAAVFDDIIVYEP